MAGRMGRYDDTLQMFVEEPREPDMARLTFLRWLVERRRLEHGPSGAPSGELAVRLAFEGPIRKSAEGPQKPSGSERLK